MYIDIYSTDGHVQTPSLPLCTSYMIHTQYYEFASYFRVFTLQIDPKDVFSYLVPGSSWNSFIGTPLTNMCYDHSISGAHPRAELMTLLSNGSGLFQTKKVESK